MAQKGVKMTPPFTYPYRWIFGFTSVKSGFWGYFDPFLTTFWVKNGPLFGLKMDPFFDPLFDPFWPLEAKMAIHGAMT